MATPGHSDCDDYNNNNNNMTTYPEPPHFASTPMDLGLSPEPYAPYPRQSHEYPSSMAYDSNAMYAEAPYMYHSKSSPGMYADDSDMRVPSSDLSIASASSSTMGSPLSNPGQVATIPEWAAAPQGLGVTPGIVDQNDYYSGSDYHGFPSGHMEAFSPGFDYTNGKGPGYVGELSQVPRSSSRLLSPSLLRGSSMSFSSESTATVKAGLALDTRIAQSPQPPSSASPATTSASSVTSSLVFSSPASSTCSFSSPPLPAWRSPNPDRGGHGRSPPAGPTQKPTATCLVPPFFSQSSGHFVPPLESYPSLILPDVRAMAMPSFEQAYPGPNPGYPVSPAPSASPQLRSGNSSPFLHGNYQPFSPFQPPSAEPQRRQSTTFSTYSGDQSYPSGDESKEKQRCPHPDCGKIFKDLKAHMLTHQNERPEKCPIATCEYHVKGFARKYDKNRHTLTHYKGTMVCGFCPGSGSAAEKSFNRADVFKRHLTAVHGVEQTAPNGRKKTGAGVNGGNAGAKKLTGYAPDATGKCSTCSQTFSNAQDFYEHLDDCVLRIVQQEDPAEAINAQRLAEVENDRDVHNTLEKNHLPTATMSTNVEEDEDDDMEDEDAADEDAQNARKSSSPTKKTKGNPANGVQKSRGLTHSRGGVPLLTKSRGRKNRRDYPSSWGFDKGQMNMKKRVMAVFDGQRRLAKDDMMLSTEHEVRLKLPDGKSYVTDLDVQTLKRAEGFLGATDEEKGPWISDDPTEEQLKQMLKYEPPKSPQ